MLDPSPRPRHDLRVAAKSPNNAFRLAELRAASRPFRLHFFPRLRSTSDHAAALRKRGALFAPAIVLTSNQIAGRGRGGNAWFSTRGVLTVTFVLPVEHHLAPQQIPLIAGLAVRDAIAQVTGRDDFQLKWPNDILHGGKKLAGLLCERVNKVDLIGVGLNVNLDVRGAPKALHDQITSLSEIAGGELDMTNVLISIAQQLYPALSRRGERPFAEMLRRYDAYHALPGTRITVTHDQAAPVTGIVEGVDSSGRLILRDRGKLHHIIAGQVQTR
jgi:BirA family biotin operon repressor/biotin-[acetyl-CoA-carboxylase] ligase